MDFVLLQITCTNRSELTRHFSFPQTCKLVMSEESSLVAGVEGEEEESLGKNESEDEEKGKENSTTAGKTDVQESGRCELVVPDRYALLCNELKASTSIYERYFGSETLAHRGCMGLYKPRGMAVF